LRRRSGDGVAKFARVSEFDFNSIGNQQRVSFAAVRQIRRRLVLSSDQFLLLSACAVAPVRELSYLSVFRFLMQDGGVAVSESDKGQIRFNDPEGNRVVISEGGWAN